MTVLLDSNVAIALLADDHVHHQRARRWLSNHAEGFATCPVVQGAVVRYVLRSGLTAKGAIAALRSMIDLDRHEFWPDDLDYGVVRLDGVIGHRQVTDAYLAALARRRGARVVTFDESFAALHPDVVDLVSNG